MKVIWKEAVSGYEVSNYGDVRNATTGKVLSQKTDKDGYKLINLNNKTYRVNRLVAAAFIPTDDYTLEVNHMDKNRSNNNVYNLEWITHKENCSVENKSNSSRKVKCVESGEVFSSARNAERKTGAEHSGILRCCKNIRKYCGGYTWVFA